MCVCVAAHDGVAAAVAKGHGGGFVHIHTVFRFARAFADQREIRQRFLLTPFYLPAFPPRIFKTQFQTGMGSTFVVADTARDSVHMMITGISAHDELTAINSATIKQKSQEQIEVANIAMAGNVRRLMRGDVRDSHRPKYINKNQPRAACHLCKSEELCMCSIENDAASGRDPGDFQSPLGVAMDRNGHIFTTDNNSTRSGSARVQIFDNDGHLLTWVDNDQFEKRGHPSYPEKDYAHILMDCNGKPLSLDEEPDYISVEAELPVCLADLVDSADQGHGHFQLRSWESFAASFASSLRGSIAPHWYTLLYMEFNARVGLMDWPELLKFLKLPPTAVPTWYTELSAHWDITIKEHESGLKKKNVGMRHLIEATGAANELEPIGHVWVKGIAVNAVTSADDYVWDGPDVEKSKPALEKGSIRITVLRADNLIKADCTSSAPSLLPHVLPLFPKKPHTRSHIARVHHTYLSCHMTHSRSYSA